MRAFIPIGLAFVLGVFAAAAIFSSGQVLSFSAPGFSESAGDRGPAEQSQPNDFGGSGLRDYYFGPDFMCLIYGTDRIECFGSDEHNVVSDTPTQFGFSEVDGGETYACAFRSIDRFTYCWGSITRQPAKVQPTATAEATATAEPTATAMPTPEPITRGSCHVQRTGSATYPLTLTGTWTTSCVYDNGYPYIWDEWRQQGTGSVTITASSEGDPNISLFEIDESVAVGEEGWASRLAFDDDIDTAGGNYDAQITHPLGDGKRYLISVSPYDSDTTGDFTLTYTSTDSGLGWAAGYDPGSGAGFDHRQIGSMLGTVTK